MSLEGKKKRKRKEIDQLAALTFHNLNPSTSLATWRECREQRAAEIITAGDGRASREKRVRSIKREARQSEVVCWQNKSSEQSIAVVSTVICRSGRRAKGAQDARLSELREPARLFMPAESSRAVCPRGRKEGRKEREGKAGAAYREKVADRIGCVWSAALLFIRLI